MFQTFDVAQGLIAVIALLLGFFSASTSARCRPLFDVVNPRHLKSRVYLATLGRTARGRVAGPEELVSRPNACLVADQTTER